MVPPKDLRKKVKIWRLLKSRDVKSFATHVAFREMRWCNVSVFGFAMLKRGGVVHCGETILSLALQMTGQTISNN